MKAIRTAAAPGVGGPRAERLTQPHRAPQPTRPASAGRDAGPPWRAGSRRRSPAVLLAHDEPVVRAVLAYLLQATGRRITVAASAAETRDLARSGRFDLLILDERLAGGGGLEALEALRADPACAATPALLLARSDLGAVGARCAAAAAEALPMARASDVATLLELVARLLDAAGGRSSDSRTIYTTRAADQTKSRAA